MDASDIIRRLQARTIYAYTRDVVQAKQPACNLSTCCVVSSCVLNFPSYEYAYNFKLGQKSCNASTCQSVYHINNVDKVCCCSGK